MKKKWKIGTLMAKQLNRKSLDQRTTKFKFKSNLNGFWNGYIKNKYTNLFYKCYNWI